MRVEYSSEEKQLIVIATNLEEQNRLEGLSAFMSHGDECQINFDLSPSPVKAEVCIEGATQKRGGEAFKFQLLMNDGIHAILVFDLACSGACNYLWSGEMSEVCRNNWNWRTLVFGHV